MGQELLEHHQALRQAADGDPQVVNRVRVPPLGGLVRLKREPAEQRGGLPDGVIADGNITSSVGWLACQGSPSLSREHDWNFIDLAERFRRPIGGP